MSSLWLSIEPSASQTRLMLSQAKRGTTLKALFPPVPADRRALARLLEAIVAWYGLPLCAVLDADAEAVRRDPVDFALSLGDLGSPQIEVAWVAPGAPPRGRVRDLEGMGSFQRARQLISLASTGQR